MDYLLLLMWFLCSQFNVYTKMCLLQYVSMSENYDYFLSTSSNVFVKNVRS